MTLIMECYKSIMASSVLSGLDVDFGRKTWPPKYCYPGFWKICACFLNGVNCIAQSGNPLGGSHSLLRNGTIRYSTSSCSS